MVLEIKLNLEEYQKHLYCSSKGKYFVSEEREREYFHDLTYILEIFLLRHLINSRFLTFLNGDRNYGNSLYMHGS